MSTRETDRRQFLHELALATGGVVLAPIVTSCASQPKKDTAGPPSTADVSSPATQAALAVPRGLPAVWDPIAFNRARGNAGAIPESYRSLINGPDGEKKHLGKHLPYVPKLDGPSAPAGMVALMWGDPSKGHARHPNAPRSETNNHEGHWYNWITVRKAVDGEAQETKSVYPEWPGTPEQRDQQYIVHGGGDISADGGRNTVYLAALPADVAPGDTVRVYAHCLTHGEYVDFITL